MNSVLRLLNREQRQVSDLAAGLSVRWISGAAKRTQVMGFGDGSQGQLWLPESQMGMSSCFYEPTAIPVRLPDQGNPHNAGGEEYFNGLPQDISSIVAGHYHSLAVTCKGHLWTWGRNNEGQLGRDPLTSREKWHVPCQVNVGLDEVNVKAAFASGVISAVLDDRSSLYVWGESKRGQLGLGKNVTQASLPSQVEALAGEEIAKVSLGWGHALALTNDGKLFGWGYYADGRLGRIGRSPEASPLDAITGGLESADETSDSSIEIAEKLVEEAIEKEKDMPIVWEPSLVEELCNVEVIDIACGFDHSLVLCSDGTLLSGGSNVYGQLGRVNQNMGFHPVDISLRPISIAAGLGHNMAICKDTSSGDGRDELKLVTWGWNQNSQLGREGPEDVPLIVDGLDGETPISMSAGRAHSLVATAEKQLWAWGCGRLGRLGLGSSVDEAEPMLVESLLDSEVLQAAAGLDHTLVLVAQ